MGGTQEKWRPHRHLQGLSYRLGLQTPEFRLSSRLLGGLLFSLALFTELDDTGALSRRRKVSSSHMPLRSRPRGMSAWPKKRLTSTKFKWRTWPEIVKSHPNEIKDPIAALRIKYLFE